MRTANALLPGAGFETQALLAPEQALTLFFAHARVRPPQAEKAALERARGRVLAADIRADRPYPGVARSTMDGFAVRAERTPGEFVIAGEIRMGEAWAGETDRGAALRIPTGGAVPAGFDAVVPIEDAAVDADRVRIAQSVPAGDCITPLGADMQCGAIVLHAGRRIGGPELGVLATLGILDVPVYRRPQIAVLSSGNELVDVSAAPGPAQIRDSNRWAITATLEAFGAQVRQYPIAPDESERLEALMRDAAASCDAVVLTGGSSVGEHDLTARAVRRLGEPGVIVHGLRVKPGKPTVLGAAGRTPIVGLPGNPASALMILEAVVAPIVAALTGALRVPATTQAVLGAAYEKRAGWTWYVPVVLDQAQAPCVAHPLPLHSSSVSLLARADGYMVLNESTESLACGAPVPVTRFTSGAC